LSAAFNKDDDDDDDDDGGGVAVLFNNCFSTDITLCTVG